MSKGILEDVMPVDRVYSFTRDGRREYTGCKTCARVLDDSYEAGDTHAAVGSQTEEP